MNKELLKWELALRGMDITNVAGMLNMSVEYLNALLEGKKGDIRLKHMEIIRKNTGIPARKLEKIFFEEPKTCHRFIH